MVGCNLENATACGGSNEVALTLTALKPVHRDFLMSNVWCCTRMSTRRCGARAASPRSVNG